MSAPQKLIHVTGRHAVNRKREQVRREEFLGFADRIDPGVGDAFAVGVQLLRASSRQAVDLDRTVTVRESHGA